MDLPAPLQGASIFGVATRGGARGLACPGLDYGCAVGARNRAGRLGVVPRDEWLINPAASQREAIGNLTDDGGDEAIHLDQRRSRCHCGRCSCRSKKSEPMR